MSVKSDLLHVVERNKSKSDATEAYELILSGKRSVFFWCFSFKYRILMACLVEQGIYLFILVMLLWCLICREQRPQDFLDCIVDLREYDVPYHVRFAIDNGKFYLLL